MIVARFDDKIALGKTNISAAKHNKTKPCKRKHRRLISSAEHCLKEEWVFEKHNTWHLAQPRNHFLLAVIIINFNDNACTWHD